MKDKVMAAVGRNLIKSALLSWALVVAMVYVCPSAFWFYLPFSGIAILLSGVAFISYQRR